MSSNNEFSFLPTVASFQALLHMQTWHQVNKEWRTWLLQIQGSKKIKNRVSLLLAIIVHNSWMARNRRRHQNTYRNICDVQLIVEECILVNYKVLKCQLYDLRMLGSLNWCTCLVISNKILPFTKKPKKKRKQWENPDRFTHSKNSWSQAKKAVQIWQANISDMARGNRKN